MQDFRGTGSFDRLSGVIHGYPMQSREACFRSNKCRLGRSSNDWMGKTFQKLGAERIQLHGSLQPAAAELSAEP